ncbi:hypothetical protein ACQ4M3_17580 [Leptolyngbya sp. AN03gr2]|uniref:hypothetical protein n=1 Tax=unclassified Leptolyngbya TaxID=2650499 RepID=UPI003D3204ED
MRPSLMRSSHTFARKEAVLSWLTVLALVYLLIVGVGDISSGFRAAIEGGIEQLFAFANHPLVGLTSGILATTLVQSSSTTTAIVVGLVAGGFPVSSAVPIVMGANIGTSVTAGMVSLSYPSDEQGFRNAFSAATVLDLFNLFAVLLFFPLEVLFHPFERLSIATTQFLFRNPNPTVDHFDIVGLLTYPARSLIRAMTALFPEPFNGFLHLLIGISLICSSLYFIRKILQRLMIGRIRAIYSALGRGSIAALLTGMFVTILVQSASVATSLMVPFASAGVFSLKAIYPFTLGANLGATVTSLIAATAIRGTQVVPALEIALVYLFFNLFSVFVIFGLPVLRPLPMIASERLAAAASENSFIAFAYMMGGFLLLPLMLVGLSIVV